MTQQKTIITRDQIPAEYTWNAESVYATPADLAAAFDSMPVLIDKAKSYQGRLKESPVVLLEAIGELQELMRHISRLTMYTSMAYAVNTTDQQAGKTANRAQGLSGRAFAAIAYFNPELLAIGRETLDQWMETEPHLAVYEHYFDNLFRKEAHTRSSEVEEIFGMLNDPFHGVYNTFMSMLSADFRFEPARSSTGEEIPFTGNSLHAILTTPDREARRTAWENYSDTHLNFKNTLTSNLSTYMKQNLFLARARRHSSTLEAALFNNNIPVDVFHNLIDTFRANLPVWKRYWAIRRKALGVEQLETYDTWAPLATGQPEVTYEQSVELVVNGLKPLGSEYVETVRQGCLRDRWVDVYPNQGKTAGAFSTGAADTFPFIKMNFDHTIFSVSTLAHELGHSMHSYLSRQNQPIMLARYTIFLAEVASNFNQAMVRAYLLENNPDPAFQLSVIEEAMYNFHRYFFVMPTLARFEREAYQRLELGQGFSPDDLIELTADLFEEAYSGEMHIDRPRVGITWATFQHMYMNYYVFQYATGIAGANALAKRILDGEPGAVDAYLGFLKSGGSRYSLDILKDAGVDLSTPAPVEAAFQVMSGYIDRLEKLYA